MKPNKLNNQQDLLFKFRFSNELNQNHPLVQLSKLIEWKQLEEEFDKLFVENVGQPAKPVRLVVGLFILQHMYGISDENVVHRWVENPYWQYFCGYDHFKHELPIHPTSLIKWRDRLGEAGLSKVLQETIVAAVLTGAVKKKALKKSLPIQR
ncbi:hypothetical protein NEOC65_000636 [Neochlamydia sp. AcF65]|uniref:transposase n=1 Tax=Neochlamydia sp. AcF65 TaxID=2795735 RepID=UPI001BC8E765|nr:transposase [Neochlamydia sp. AcF65]MBS4164960.1 hypothetical protein [Neochlamydia sp. AcF65]MBS4165512.1 hypothetical protein [Neochlamydia sp. AcF65]MBS4165574.1 hypothetical protein [Neochlamydia sp. AcF65]